MSTSAQRSAAQERLAQADILWKATHRALGIATALSFMAEVHLDNSARRADAFRNSVDELSAALSEALTPAIWAVGDLERAAREEVEAMDRRLEAVS